MYVIKATRKITTAVNTSGFPLCYFDNADYKTIALNMDVTSSGEKHRNLYE